MANNTDEKTGTEDIQIEKNTEDIPPVSRSRTFMSGKYPDATWEDDDAYETALADHLEGTDKILSEYQLNDQRIADIIERHPDFALVLEDLSKGVPFRVALRRNIDLSDLTPEEQDKDYDDWKAASDEYLENKRKTDEEINTRNTNLPVSEKRFSDFIDSRTDWDDQKKEGFVKFFQDVLMEVARGEITDRTLSMFSDAYTHDEDVETAMEEGKTEGRNDKIVSRRIKQDQNTDQVPDSGGSNPAPEPPADEPEDIFDEVARYSRRKRM